MRFDTPQLEMHEVFTGERRARSQSRARNKENNETRNARAVDSDTRMRSTEKKKGGGGLGEWLGLDVQKATSKGKEKAKEQNKGGEDSATPKGPLEDYSKYKGRGRYGKDKEKTGYVRLVVVISSTHSGIKSVETKIGPSTRCTLSIPLGTTVWISSTMMSSEGRRRGRG